MTPDTRPYCGAPLVPEAEEWYECGTNWMSQSPECARYVRVRIAHLRRMIQCAWGDWDRHFNTPKQDERIERFARACLRKIDRLRGGA